MPTDDSEPPKASSSSLPPSRLDSGRKHSWDEWWRAARTVKPNDLKNIEQVPCARQSFVYGIAGGAAIGCTRFLTSNPVVASNWAVASFVIISAVSWNRCRSLQSSQKEQIKAIQDQMDEKARRAALARRGQPVASSDPTSSQGKS